MKQPRAAIPVAIGLVLTLAAAFLISTTSFRIAGAADEPFRCDDASLYFPVAGTVGWRYGDPASTDTDAGGNPTPHTGVDVFGDGGNGAPVYAPTRGMVSRLSGSGGVNLILFDVTNVLTGEANIELYVAHMTHSLQPGRQFAAGDVLGNQQGDHVHFSVGAFMGFDDRQLDQTQDPSPHFGAILTYDPTVTDRYDVAVWCDPSASDVEVASAPPANQPVASASTATVASQDQEYFVQSGDTLSAIAAGFDVTVDAIAQASGLTDVDVLEVGQRLVIPGAGGSQPAGGGQPGDGAATTLQAAPVVDQVYVVREGDTLSTIAEAFGVTVDELIAANALSDADFISIGQELQVRSGANAGATASTGDTGTTGALEPVGSYVVQDGDTLSTIAQAHGTDVETLQALNAIEDPEFISIGDILILP